MAKTRQRRRPATSVGGRENQLISMAVDLVEKQLEDGTASAQVISHYLKLGSTREQLEQERLRNENLVLQAKVDSMASAKRIEELYTSALEAMRRYQGQDPEPQEEYDEG